MYTIDEVIAGLKYCEDTHPDDLCNDCPLVIACVSPVDSVTTHLLEFLYELKEIKEKANNGND